MIFLPHRMVFMPMQVGLGCLIGLGLAVISVATGARSRSARVRSQPRLKSQAEWFTYCRSGKKPIFRPYRPMFMPMRAGSIVDWLGAGRRIGNWRPFNEARAFVRSLELKSGPEWNVYCRSGKKPNDIPADTDGLLCHRGLDWNV